MGPNGIGAIHREVIAQINMLQYNSKISVPNLFNESDTAAGKTTYQEGYELVFDREGDTYTLSGVTCNGSPIASASNLDNIGAIHREVIAQINILASRLMNTADITY